MAGWRKKKKRKTKGLFLLFYILLRARRRGRRRRDTREYSRKETEMQKVFVSHASCPKRRKLVGGKAEADLARDF
jgi:hypothetical protein